MWSGVDEGPVHCWCDVWSGVAAAGAVQQSDSVVRRRLAAVAVRSSLRTQAQRETLLSYQVFLLLYEHCIQQKDFLLGVLQ